MRTTAKYITYVVIPPVSGRKSVHPTAKKLSPARIMPTSLTLNCDVSATNGEQKAPILDMQ
jgi:hypothetical protein